MENVDYNEASLYMSKEVKVEKGYYYRLRGYHSCTKSGVTENGGSVTDGIYNDTVAISKRSPYYTDELKEALQQCFINIINTEKGKEIFGVYSHAGYAIATDADYDSARAALKAVSE